MRMGIGAAHDLPLVLEDLDPGVLRAEVAALPHPCADDTTDRLRGHPCERQVVPGRKTDHAALATNGLGGQKVRRVRREESFPLPDLGWQQGGEIVWENVRLGVVRVYGPAGPLVAGAQVALRIMRRAAVATRALHLSLPRPLRAVGRHQNPISRETVESAVRIVHAVYIQRRFVGSSGTH